MLVLLLKKQVHFLISEVINVLNAVINHVVQAVQQLVSVLPVLYSAAQVAH